MILVRAFVIIGGLIVLALTAALVGPYFVDWTGYRQDFEREASRILGRDVTVAGSATARLLPFPSVTFSDVRVAGGEDGQPAMTVERFSMDAELAPFLSGEVLIFDMRLDRPKATVRIGRDGSVDWTARPRTEIGAGRITLENVTITDGVVTVLHEESGRSHRLTDIDATVAARTLAGPWRFDGTAAIDGVRAALTASTGIATEEGRLRLRLTARPVAYPVSIETDGDVTVGDEGTTYGGQFRVASLQADGARAAGAAEPAPPVSVNGRFTMDHERLTASEYVFQTGPADAPYTAEGDAWLAFGPEPRFRIAASGAQFRLDDGDAGAAAGQAPAERLAALRGLIARLPRPGIPGSVEVSLPAIVAGDTTIRQVDLRAEPAPDGWTIRSLSAQLPGRTTLEANGLLKTGDQFGFIGSLLVAVAQPSGFAAWMARDVDEAIRKLPAAGFLSAVEIAPERQSFRNLELILGGSRFKGSMESQTQTGQRPAMQVELDGGALDLDGLAAFASLFIGDGGQARLGARDIDISLKAGPVTAAGLRAGSVDAGIRLREDAVEIDRLTIGDFAGASISATGSLADLQTSRTGTLDASLVAPDLAAVAEALAARFPDNRLAEWLAGRARSYPALFSDARIDVTAKAAKGIAQPVTISAAGKTGGTDFTLNASMPLIAETAGSAPVSLALSADSEDAAALFALYGLPALPLGLAGPADTVLTLSGTAEGGLRTRLILSGDGSDAAFDGTVRYQDALTLSGNASLEAEDLEPWLSTTGIVLPGMGLGTPVRLKAKTDFESGVLVLSGVEGDIAGVGIKGDLNAEMKADRPHLTGEVQLGALDLALPAAIILGDAVLGETAGLSDTEVVFATNAEPAFTANLSIDTASLMIGQSAALSDARLDAALEADGLRVSNVEASWRGGKVTGFAELRNVAGSGLFSTQFALEEGNLAALFPRSTVSGGVGMGMTLTATGKSISGLASSLGGSGTVSLTGLSIPGINPAAFPRIIAAADGAGREIDAAKVADFVPPLVGGGRFEGGDTQMAIAVANGVMRVAPVRLETDGATMTAEGRLDATTGAAELSGEIVYDAGKEAIAGATPAVDFSTDGWPGEMTVRFDTGRMTQFLTQRALEIEQARVEAMQMALLERQRLRREVAYYEARAEARAAAEAERQRLEREDQQRREEEARRTAEEAEQARLRAEEDARRAAEEEERRRDPPPDEPAPVPTPPSVAPAPADRAADPIERRPLSSPATGSLPGVSTDPLGAGTSSEQPASRDPGTIFQSIDNLLKEIAPGQ